MSGTVMKKISELVPADYNPRVDLQRGDEEYEKLKKVIAKFGLVQPIVFNSRTNTVVGGHQRLKVAKDLGYTEVPTYIVDLDLKDEKVLNLALNKVGGEFDDEKLGKLLADLQLEAVELDLTGFDDFEIDELVAAFGDNENVFDQIHGTSNEEESEEDPFSLDDVPDALGLEKQSSDGERVSMHKMILGTRKIVITEAEWEQIMAKYDQYVEINRNDYGFVGWLCDGGNEDEIL